MTTHAELLGIVCRVATIAEIMDLRYSELRAGMPREAACFEGDEQATTHHFGAFLSGGENVGCASFMLNSFGGQPAYQLRGMASRVDMVGRGVGRTLLRFGEEHLLKTSGVTRLWCNARVPAIGFYEKQGWVVVSEVFDVPTAGPHRRMTKNIGA